MVVTGWRCCFTLVVNRTLPVNLWVTMVDSGFHQANAPLWSYLSYVNWQRPSHLRDDAWMTTCHHAEEMFLFCFQLMRNCNTQVRIHLWWRFICHTADYLGFFLRPGFYRGSASLGNVKRLFINTKDEKGRCVSAFHTEMENLRLADVQPVKLYQLVFFHLLFHP